MEDRHTWRTLHEGEGWNQGDQAMEPQRLTANEELGGASGRLLLHPLGLGGTWDRLLLHPLGLELRASRAMRKGISGVRPVLQQPRTLTN